MKKLRLFASCFALLFAACGDDTNEPDKQGPLDPPGPPDPPVVQVDAKKFMKEVRDGMMQKFDLNTTDLPKTLELDGGIRITIPDGALTKGGIPITGDFTVEILEVMTPSAAIFSGANMNYRGGGDFFLNPGYFISDGFFNIDVKQDGKSIDGDLADGKFLQIFVPFEDETRNETMIWEGDVEDGRFAWEEPDMEDIEAPDQGREINMIWKGKEGFDFGFGKLGWCNCDIFWGEGPLTTVTVKLTGNVGKLASYMGFEGDTFVIFKPKGHFTVCQLYTIVGENTVASYDNSMPVGHEGTMLAFSITDNKFSLAVKQITIEEDMHMELDLKEVKKEDLVNAIKALDTK